MCKSLERDFTVALKYKMKSMNSKFEMVSGTRSSHVPWTQPVTSPKRGDEGRCLHDYMLCVQEFS